MTHTLRRQVSIFDSHGLPKYSYVSRTNGIALAPQVTGYRASGAGPETFFALGCFGSSEKESMRTLPDYLRKGMKMILVGSNPGDRSARVGHYYAGRGNQFWPILYEAGVIPEPIGYEDDRRVVEFGIGLTDLVKRPTRAADELERQEFAEGRVLLAQKLEEMKPRVIAFNGKIVFEKFSGRPCKLGLQKEKLYGAQVFVLPSTSGQNGGTERAVKMRYFKQLASLLKTLKD